MKNKMKKISLVAVATVLALSNSSCALMFNGSRKDVPIRSMTQGSQIYVDGDLKGTDAVNVKLRRNSNHTIMIKKEGYKTQIIPVTKHADAGWIVFDALINWGAFLTDPTTGAWNVLEPDSVTVEVEKEK
jgi:hypothetical protein